MTNSTLIVERIQHFDDEYTGCRKGTGVLVKPLLKPELQTVNRFCIRLLIDFQDVQLPIASIGAKMRGTSFQFGRGKFWEIVVVLECV